MASVSTGSTRDSVAPAPLVWLWIVAAAVAGHVLLSLTVPGARWVTPLGVGSCCLIAGGCALQQAAQDAPRRWRWRLVAMTFGLWAAAFAASAWLQLTVGDTPPAKLDSLLFMARGAPLFVLLTSDPREARGPLAWLGVAQALLFVALSGALLFPALVAGDVVTLPFTSVETATSYRALENGFLALLAIVARVLQPGAADRRLIGLVAATLACYFFIALGLNHLIQSVPTLPHGSPLLVASDLPLVVFVALATRPVRDGAPPRSLGTASGIAWLLAPTAVVLATLAVALALVPRVYPAAVAGAGATLALYAARSVALQLRDVRAQAALIAAHDAMARLARIDALTGVANRRSFDAALAAAWAATAARAQPLTLLLIDVDHFKRLNDRLGHVAGDACLRAIAATMQAELAPEALLARYGGEEFAVVAPGCAPPADLALAERLRTAVERAALGDPAMADEAVTVSIGLATTTDAQGGGTALGLLALADAALYAAKRGGRNIVMRGGD